MGRWRVECGSVAAKSAKKTSFFQGRIKSAFPFPPASLPLLPPPPLLLLLLPLKPGKQEASLFGFFSASKKIAKSCWRPSRTSPLRPGESDPEALPDPPDASFFLRTRDSSAAMTSDSFYEEDASRQILQRIANVFNDPDICDAVFVVGEEREEICAPSQFMAISSPYFKELFYPPREDARREIRDMEPQVFRKILDYLFRGRVSLSTVEDAWRVKSAGARFQLKDLEDLCTKFLKYRLDSSNLITFLKSSTKYEAQDLKDAVLARFSREANSVLAQDAVLDLSESELISLLETEPSVQASKLMEVLIKWAKKRYGFVGFFYFASNDTSHDCRYLFRLDIDEKQAENGGGDSNGAAAAGENGSGGGEAMDTSANGTAAAPAAAPVEQPEVNLIKPLQNFMKFVVWERADAAFFLKNIRKRKIMSEDDENRAMAQILQSFVQNQQPVSTVLIREGCGGEKVLLACS